MRMVCCYHAFLKSSPQDESMRRVANGCRHTSFQEQCQALQLQLEEQAREAGETEKGLKEEVCI